MKIGTTTIPLAGWLVDPSQVEESRERRLSAIRQIVENYRLSAVELTLDLGLLFPKVFDEEFYARVGGLQQSLGFTCTAHLPFLWVDASSMNEVIRIASLESIEHMLKMVQPIQVEAYVVHLWGATTSQIDNALGSISQKELVLSALQLQAERSLRQLCEQVANPALICVENLETPPFDFVLPLVERHGASICLDVGHLAWQGDDELSFLTEKAARIREVHLHDSKRVFSGGFAQTTDHLPLGNGFFDYLKFMQNLDSVGFDGCVILEVNTRAGLEQSLEKIRQFIE